MIPHQVLRAQEQAAEQSQSMAESLNEARVDLSGLSTKVSDELKTAMEEIEKQVCFFRYYTMSGAGEVTYV